MMPSLLNSIDAVLFDIGSTLIMGPSVSPTKEIAKHFGLSAEKALQVTRLVMCTDFQGPADVCRTLQSVGIGINQDDCEFVSRLWHDQETSARPIEGGLETVRFFQEAGKAIGLLSDIWPAYYRAFTQVCPEIAELAEIKQLSFQVHLKKPEAAFFQSAIQAFKMPPHRILMVGDTYSNDIAPAIQQGMKTAWILSRAEREVPELVGVISGSLPRPDVTVGSILDLMQAVKEEESSAYQSTPC